tara:strand:+ start:481 stop:642 length:162 start_codon:yes stop_codon:yes gene_type:complete
MHLHEVGQHQCHQVVPNVIFSAVGIMAKSELEISPTSSRGASLNATNVPLYVR